MKRDNSGKRALGALAAAVSLALISGAALAADNYSNIVASAECTVDADGILTVDVGYTLDSGPAPAISSEHLHVEKNFYYDTGKNKGKTEWVTIAHEHIFSMGGTDQARPFEGVDLCSYGDYSDTNSLRAEVVITVDNANPKRKGGNDYLYYLEDGEIVQGDKVGGGLDFLARCVSFTPPACPPAD